MIARDFADLLGYTLVASTRQVRLVRKLDSVDPTQRTIFVTRSGRPFDRRRLAYLCLVLAVFQRSRIEISLADLVRALAPTANAIAGLGFDATITEHKRAIVDAIDWLCDHGALRLSDGSAEIWAHDTERGDALYDIDHDVCSLLFRPSRPIQQLTGVADLLEPAETSLRPSAQRDAAARRARRLLIEHPVVYYPTRRCRHRDRAARPRPGRQPREADRPRGRTPRRGSHARRPHRSLHRSPVPWPGRRRQPRRRTAPGQVRRPARRPRYRPGRHQDAGAVRTR